MGVEERRRVLEALVRVLPEETEAAGMGRDTCVFCSWIGREVLRRFGISAKPVAVRAAIVNRQFWEDVGEDWNRVLDVKDDGLREESWSVALGFSHGPPEKGRWAGHLILTTRNPDMVLDLTLDQASRPEKGIPLEPLAYQVDRSALRAFERGESPLEFAETDHGCRIVYGMVPDLSPSSGADWNGSDDREIRAYRDEFAGRVEARIRREVSL
jgi:hypothetical protein